MSDEMYEGIDDTEETEYDEGVYEGDEYEEEPAEAEAPAEDPWDFLKSYEPEKIRPTIEKFTQSWEEELRKREELVRMEQELEPFRKMKDELENNPALFKVISDFMENERDPQVYVQEMRDEVENLRAQIRIEREIADLHKDVTAKGLPDFDDEKLVKHAISKGLPLDVAYRDMNFDVVPKITEQKVIKDIKKSRGATAPSGTPKGGDVVSPPTVEEIANMSAEDFASHYAEIAKRIQPKGGRRPSL